MLNSNPACWPFTMPENPGSRVNGPCAGISYSYAMACDLMVMAKSSYLFQPFVGIGLVPDGGSTWLLPNFVGAKRALS